MERLVKSYCQQGLFGWEVTDAEISLINGKCDNVGSDPADFNIAVPIALMRAFKDAGMKKELEIISGSFDLKENSSGVPIVLGSSLAYRIQF